MNDDDRDIWFPAKRYGWGWGFPIAWQGWVVLLVYLVLLFLGTNEFLANTEHDVLCLPCAHYSGTRRRLLPER